MSEEINKVGQKIIENSNIQVRDEKQKIFGLQIQSDRKLYVCPYDLCGRIFHEERNMKAHARTHITNKAFICTLKSCGAEFLKLDEFNHHKSSHQINQFICFHENCGRSFSRKHRLLAHEKTHSGHKPFVCKHPDCGKAFVEHGNLKIHMRIHSNEKPYQCYYQKCQKKFRTIGQLNDHINTHLKKRPFRCEICDISYVRRSILNKHNKIRHSIGKLNNDKKNIIVENKISEENLAMVNTVFENSTENLSNKNKSYSELKIIKTENISLKKNENSRACISLASKNFCNFEEEFQFFQKEATRVCQLIILSRNLFAMINKSSYLFLESIFQSNNMEHLFLFKTISELISKNEQVLEAIRQAINIIQDRL